MTDEEAIERVHDLIHTCEVGIEKHGEYDDLFEKDKEALERVLRLISEKDKSVEFWKQAFELKEKSKIHCKKSLKGIINKQNRMIREMAFTISSMALGIDIITKQEVKKYCEFVKSEEDCCWKTTRDCDDCIIEYFEKKVEG